MRKENIFDKLNQNGIEPVSNPLAQIEELGVPAADKSSQLFDHLNGLTKKESIEWSIRCIIDFMLKSGCRVSAVINKKGFKISSSGKVTLFETKTKTQHEFYSPFVDSYLFNYKGKYCFLFTNYSRYQIYRIFKKLEIHATITGLTKESVTHLPRHIVGSLAYKDSNDLKSAAKEIGHLSTKSTQTYVNEVK